MRQLFLFRLLAVVITVTLLPVGAAAASPSRSLSSGPSQDEPSRLRVATVNLREGSLRTPRADRRDRTDVRRASRRLLARPGPVPDVVLLQEVLGSAGVVARALNRHPRADRTGARYRVATTTRKATVRGECDGRRGGSFLLLRSSAVLVNTRTVEDVHAQGFVRTWGRWHRSAWRHTGRRGQGCAVHPWVRLTVRQPGQAPRQVIAASVHTAPSGAAPKTRAVRVVQRALGQVRGRHPGAGVVLAGDLNLNRCRQPLSAPEPRSCHVRTAHRRLLDAGYRDAVRALHPDGPTGVVGVARRVDFVYTVAPPRSARFDRCYRAWLVTRWRCSAARTTFATAAGFNRCQARSLNHGRPGDGCPPARFRRYYSDHPVIVATVG